MTLLPIWQQSPRLRDPTQWRAFIDDLPDMVRIADEGRTETWPEALAAVRKERRLVAMAPGVKRRLEAEKAALPKPAEAIATPEAQGPELPNGTPLDRTLSAAIKQHGVSE